MKFEPKNRRLYVRRVGRNSNRKDKRNDGILLPTKDVKFEDKGNELYAVISKAEDVKLKVDQGDYILVEASMVERDVFRSNDGKENHVFLTVLENYVKGVISSWEEESEETT